MTLIEKIKAFFRGAEEVIEETLEDKFNSARALAGYATFSFTNAIEALDEATATFDALSVEALGEIERLNALHAANVDEAIKTATVAHKLRALVGDASA